MKNHTCALLVFGWMLTGGLFLNSPLGAAEVKAAPPAPRPLFAGWANADITPAKPVNLIGQYDKRISKKKPVGSHLKI
jgi:hypothetical protein